MSLMTVPISTREVIAGHAMAACPRCYDGIAIMLPAVRDILRDWEGPALKLGFGQELAPQQRALFDVLYANRPTAVPFEIIQAHLGNLSPRTADVMVYRLRCSLKPHGWGVVVRKHAVRLVEPEKEDLA